MRKRNTLVALLVGIVATATFAGQTPAAPPPAGGPGGRQGGRGAARGVQIPAGEECPPGTTETRPRLCTAPEFPPPSIVDYRPTSTLVTSAHLVPKAKFP